jgi:hypothetical protein
MKPWMADLSPLYAWVGFRCCSCDRFCLCFCLSRAGPEEPFGTAASQESDQARKYTI